MKPYYEDGLVTLYHGDCIDVLDSLDPGFGLVLTDPPYNVGCTYDGYSDDLTDDQYYWWCVCWFEACRKLSDRIIIFPGHGNLPLWMRMRKPSGVGCWFKPGNPAHGGVFQFCEWEPFLLWGKGMGGSDVIRETVNRQLDTGDHPCPKPIGLFNQIIERAKPHSVLDPFVGSGTTLVAAKAAGVRGVGIEKSERYCEIAAKRLAQGSLFEVMS